MKPLGLLPVLGWLVAGTASAQIVVNGTVGPNPVPVGCDVSITVSNDQPGSFSTTPCPYRVFDAGMNLVFDPACTPAAILMGPYGWSTSYWDQRDQAGQPVAPGTYFVEVSYDFGPPTMHQVVIGGTQAGIVLEGRATIGQTLGGQPRNFYLCAPGDAGFPYLMAGSFSAAAGTPTCAGPFPLDFDALTALGLGGGVFGNFTGVLGPDGTSTAPTLPLPPDGNLVGLAPLVAFVVLDPKQTCIVRRISGVHAMEVLP